MVHFNILAQAAQESMVVKFQDLDIVLIDRIINNIWEQIMSLSWPEAVLAISFGVVYMLYGWRIFKILVVISFALIGLYLGMRLGAMVGSQMWGGVVGLLLLAAVSVPLMKWCVCVLGAVAGGILTGSLWHAFGFSESYILAGMAIGFVAGGMISFIVFKAAVMLFTSLGGSAITVVAVLALLRLYETEMVNPPTTHIHDLVFDQNWFLPVALILPTFVGMAMQNKFVRHSKKWEL